MCIVSYVPTSTGFMLTFNRDEVFTRASSSPQKYAKKRQKLYYPTDRLHGGSWIGVNATKSTVGCILNAKGKQPLFKTKSRGLLFLESLTRSSLHFNKNQLYGIAPFTCFLFFINDNTVMKYSWNGDTFLSEQIDPHHSFILCSSSLYSLQTQQHIGTLFKDEVDDADLFSAASFHLKLRHKRNDSVYLKQQSDIQTVSITSISAYHNKLSMTYYDILADKTNSFNIQ